MIDNYKWVKIIEVIEIIEKAEKQKSISSIAALNICEEIYKLGGPAFNPLKYKTPK